LAFLLSMTAAGWADTAPGDRGGDVNLTFPDALLMQNGGPIIDVTRPPEPGMQAAVGDGATDSTGAFQDAYDLIRKKYDETGCFSPDDEFFIYIPNGTYLIRDTIIYRGEPSKWKNAFDICHVKFVGQSRAKTILKLADQAPGFQDPAHPRPLLSYQHPDTTFNNGPANNVLRNITINTGSGNPGAAGVMFQGANQTDLRNVTITSNDGGGRYGLWLRMGSIQGYGADVTIQGFDYGIEDPVNAEGDPALEYVTLKNQNLAGIHLTGGGFSLRKLLSDQTGHGGPALKVEGSGSQAVLIDSDLRGGSGGPAIQLAATDEEGLFARNVSTEGYGMALSRAGKAEVPGAAIGEYSTTPATVLFDGQATTSLNIPIEDTPAVDWGDSATDWVVVDDISGLQAALDSGKPVICIKQRSNKLTGDVTVPASVRVIDLMGGDVDGGSFVVNQPSDTPLLVQDGGARVSVEAQRNLIGHCLARNILNPKKLPLTFWLENVNDAASGDLFCQTGQKVFARQIDVEYRNVPQIVCNGGTLWVFGFKSECKGTAAPFIVKNGGSLEVLGGYVNMLSALAPPTSQAPIVTNLDSNASVTCFTNMVGLFVNGVKETRNGETRAAANTDFPLRGAQYKRNYVIPLYVGRKAS